MGYWMGSDHNSKFTRRDFLNLLGASTSLPLLGSPVQILIESIVLGASQKAIAADLGITPRKYLHILQETAPPRWTFDLFLTPYTTNYVSNTQVGTRYSADGKSVIYQTVSRKGLNVPWLWQFSVPKASGGVRPMDDLLKNMLQIRGINVAIPSHTAAQFAQFKPLGATQTMSALSADHSKAPLAAVNAGVGNYKFVSTTGKSAISIPSSGNLLETLLAPFIRKDLGTFATKRKLLDSSLDASIAALNVSEQALNSKSELLFNANKSARELLSQGFGNLGAVWSTLQAKYRGLIARSLSTDQNLVGLNDIPILSDGSLKFSLDGEPANLGLDIRTLISTNTNCNRMADQFAMAEYILLNNLSDSISLSPMGLSDVSFNGQKSRFIFDEHTCGTFISLMGNSYLNIAYSACLLEIIDQLRAKDMFKDTVIVTGAEFGRTPDSNGDGSNHGFSGGCSAIYSGALPVDPTVIGNIYLNKKQDQRDSGTWGYAAPTIGTQPFNMGNWASSIATLLRVPSPTLAASSLLVDESGVVIPKSVYTDTKATQV